MIPGSPQKHLEMRQRRWNSSIKTTQRHPEVETSRSGGRQRAENFEEGVEGGGEVAKDENTQKPMGLLENVSLKSCRVNYEHTFAIVNFDKDPNYEVILGRPFMKQM